MIGQAKNPHRFIGMLSLPGTRRPARDFLPALLLAAMCCFHGPRAIAQSIDTAVDREFDFRIEAQALDAALDRYSLATGIQIFYASTLTKGLRSTRLAGRFSSQEAILVLLAGTHLRPRITARGAITLEPAGPIRSAAELSTGARIGSTEGTTVRLNTLRVEARLDQAAQRRYDFYAAFVRAELGRVLRQNRKLRDGRYRIQFSIWLGADGRIMRCTLHRSSGRSEIDTIVETMIPTIAIKPAPPEGMPQPLHIAISAAGT